MALYFYLHIFTISFPLLRSFEKRISYVSKWQYLFPAIFITGTFFLIWDVYFTISGIWGFNETYLIGYSFLSLPLEEWLFFLTVPFASVFIYESVLLFIKKDIFGGHGKRVLWLGSIFLVLVAVINFEKAYTFWNFLFTGVFIWISLLLLKPNHIDRFLLAYLFHLIPFLLVNGVLTGAFTESPIVWYNDDQNLAIRILTIPIEDTIYAFLLLFMNVSLYEFFKRKRFFKTIFKND